MNSEQRAQVENGWCMWVCLKLTKLGQHAPFCFNVNHIRSHRLSFWMAAKLLQVMCGCMVTTAHKYINYNILKQTLDSYRIVWLQNKTNTLKTFASCGCGCGSVVFYLVFFPFIKSQVHHFHWRLPCNQQHTAHYSLEMG